MNETGISTIQKPGRIVARNGMKQIRRVSSSVKGILVTLAFAVGRNTVPYLVFSRDNFKPHFLNC